MGGYRYSGTDGDALWVEHAGLNWWYKTRHISHRSELDVAVCAANLLDVKKVCDKHNVGFWLSEGTALGAIRQGAFITHDDDVDISMWYEQKQAFLRFVLPDLLAAGFRIGQVEDRRCGREAFFVALLRGGEKVDIDFVGRGMDCKANSNIRERALCWGYGGSNGAIISGGSTEQGAKTAGSNGERLGRWPSNEPEPACVHTCSATCDDLIPFLAGPEPNRSSSTFGKADLPEGLRWASFLGSRFLCPGAAYLVYLYGSNWKVPKWNHKPTDTAV
jgi:hypothetical protein